ncbi:MAG: class I SAM-dependent methyltransferase [Nostoc sp.]|uniref:class I SAM-dependent methyltransferase n=1 Tax=Nostoc sp. TaxID=1180 RepID=UPI002FF66839
MSKNEMQIDFTQLANVHFLQNLLVCPLCQARLDFYHDAIACTSCAQKFPQVQKNCIDLLPDHLVENEWNQWGERQQEMEQWYSDLIAIPLHAEWCFANDYTPYAPLLATLSGLVLDIGGGNGVVRHFLPKDVQYILLEPSLEWLATEWTLIAKRYPCMETKPFFVRGIGEYLPFPQQSFDAVLSFWSMNHAHQPEQVFHEVYRVLRAGGRFLVILEDMEPLWRDFAARTYITLGVAHWAHTFVQKLCCLGRQKWSLQNDHVRIQESEIQQWIAGNFQIVRRSWIGQYLTFELQKI